MKIPFIDLQSQRRIIGPAIDQAILSVANSGQYIMGQVVDAFETSLALFGKVPHALSCSSGTDALMLLLMAWNIGPGDAVFCPAFTFAATAEVVALVGATPVFVDIRPDTMTLDAERLRLEIETILHKTQLKPRAIIAVDLFGQPADYPALKIVAEDYQLKLIADSAQGFGCSLKGEQPIFWADATTVSFFPAKPLGAYGDGGAILMKDEKLFDHLVSLRVHGQATRNDVAVLGFEHDPKYLNVRMGINGRMDAIQAVVLKEKLKIFDAEITARGHIAERYSAGLKSAVTTTPVLIDGGRSVWAQYTIEHQDRAGLAEHLKQQGIPTAVHYPIPLHQQPAYAHFAIGSAGYPVSEAKAKAVISLPMSAYLEETVQDYIIAAVQAYQ